METVHEPEKRKKARTEDEDDNLQTRKDMEQTLSEDQLEEAARMARIAKRAEERALERARLRKLKEREEEDKRIPTLGEGNIRKIDDRTSASNGPVVKPKFKSRKEREREALLRLEERRKAENKKATQLAKARQDFIQKQSNAERNSSASSTRARGGVNVRQNSNFEDERGRYRQDRQRGYKGEHRHHKQHNTSNSKGKVENKETSQEDKEKQLLQEIKQQYLGQTEPNKRRVRKTGEKSKKVFKFEWDESEDTSADLNPIYAAKAEGSLLFGRGYRGGVDKRDQRTGADFILELMKRRSNGTISKSELDRKRQEIEAKERSRIRKEEPVEVNWREKSLTDMTQRDWRIVREDHDIRVQGSRIPYPARNWEEMNLPEPVYEAISEMGFKVPTPIQMQAIPIGMKQRDIIGVAATGSGKTASFVIPMLVYFMRQDPKKIELCAEHGPLAVIMAPTRELAQQIDEHTTTLAKYTNFKTVSVVGGNSIQEQGFRLREGCQVVVATPGRLLDCLENHYVVFNQCGYLVLDEADKMIDMGFEPQVESVIRAMNCSMKSDNEKEVIQQEQMALEGNGLYRTTIMFSATMRPEVENLAKKYMRFPAIVKIGDEDTGKNRDIKQEVYLVSGGEGGKKSKLASLVRSTDPPVLVFANAKRTCDMLMRYLQNSGCKTAVLHSGLSQDRRESNLRDFKDGVYQALVATDVAGRGLDMIINHVINYDMATNIERYTHRIGRTGRAGRSGLASTILTESDYQMFFPLVKYLKSTATEVPTQLAKHPLSALKPGDPIDPKLAKRYGIDPNKKWY